MAARIANLVEDLANAENKVELLEDLKTLLASIPILSLSSVVPNLSFNSVFDCLSTENSEQIEVCCDVLKKLLTALQPGIILHNFHGELLAGLQHPKSAVKRLCVLQIGRVCSESPEALIECQDVIQQLVKCLADPDLDIAKIAGEVLVTLGCRNEGLDTLFHSNVMVTLQEVLAMNDTIRFRAYEMLIRICSHWPTGLLFVAESGFLQQFVNELHKDDILLQLNCLELLSDLAVAEHGLLYLDQEGIVGKLETIMHTTEDDPLASFLIPGLVKFFGCVARIRPKEVCTSNTTFVNTVFNNLTHPESESLQSLSIQTVGFIGSSIEGKLALEKLGSRMDQGVHCIGKCLREFQTDTKIISLQAMASLVRLKVPDQTAELLKLTEYWYGHFGTNTFQFLMSLSNQPFPDLRTSIQSLFQALALQPWGQTIMNNHPGFREYLLDRSTEKTKEGKEGKFEIVATLANSPTVRDIFGDPYYVQLKTYFSEGPFYVRAQAEVAMEGE